MSWMSEDIDEELPDDLKPDGDVDGLSWDNTLIEPQGSNNIGDKSKKSLVQSYTEGPLSINVDETRKFDLDADGGPEDSGPEDGAPESVIIEEAPEVISPLATLDKTPDQQEGSVEKDKSKDTSRHENQSGGRISLAEILQKAVQKSGLDLEYSEVLLFIKSIEPYLVNSLNTTKGMADDYSDECGKFINFLSRYIVSA